MDLSGTPFLLNSLPIGLSIIPTLPSSHLSRTPFCGALSLFLCLSVSWTLLNHFSGIWGEDGELDYKIKMWCMHNSSSSYQEQRTHVVKPKIGVTFWTASHWHIDILGWNILMYSIIGRRVWEASSVIFSQQLDGNIPMYVCIICT
jgi:hypothetical protein